jgi:uncharacterized membrane protein YesL
VTSEHTEQAKHIGDWIAAGTTVGAVIGWLPAIAALFTIVWTVIRIYETETVQKLIKRFFGG